MQPTLLLTLGKLDFVTAIAFSKYPANNTPQGDRFEYIRPLAKARLVRLGLKPQANS